MIVITFSNAEGSLYIDVISVGVCRCDTISRRVYIHQGVFVHQGVFADLIHTSRSVCRCDTYIKGCDTISRSVCRCDTISRSVYSCDIYIKGCL